MKTGTMLAIGAAFIGGIFLLGKSKDDEEDDYVPDIPPLPGRDTAGGVLTQARVVYSGKKVFTISGTKVIRITGVPVHIATEIGEELCILQGVPGKIIPVGQILKVQVEIIGQSARHPEWTIWDWCVGWLEDGAYGLPGGYYFALGAPNEKKMVFGPFDDLLPKPRGGSDVQSALNTILKMSPSDARKKAM